MPKLLAFNAKSGQALFASLLVGGAWKASETQRMVKRRRNSDHRMPHLRAWRESVGLSRQAVANRLGTLLPDLPPMDQAAIAKWESGETAVRVEDLELLARVYGTTADRLFFEPGDSRTPELLQRAHDIIKNADPNAVDRWLAMGEVLSPPAPKTK